MKLSRLILVGLAVVALSTGHQIDVALAAADSVSISATVSSGTGSSGSSGNTGGGGGGGSGGISTATGISFAGRAYPLSAVNILKDGQLAVTTIAGPDARFSVSLTNLSAGSYTFAVYGLDKEGRRSETFTFPVFITAGATTNVSGIFITPTIGVDKSQVKRGENLAIFGQSTPGGNITIEVNSETQLFVKTKADAAGVYLYNFDTSPLELGQHLARSKANIDTEASTFGRSAVFAVGNKTIAAPLKPCPDRADLNNDCRVNLVDFSVAAFWYKRTLNSPFALIEKTRLNGDGKVDLRDFSIMAFYWTG